MELKMIVLKSHLPSWLYVILCISQAYYNWYKSLANHGWWNLNVTTIGHNNYYETATRKKNTTTNRHNKTFYKNWYNNCRRVLNSKEKDMSTPP